MELIKYREVLLGGDILSPDTVSSISKGYHNNLKMSQSCVFLPKAQVQAPQFPVYISHFLINCKKRKPPKMDLPFLKNDITRFCWR